MIEPTVGRVVWFYKFARGGGHKGPLAAHVCKVHSPQMVNLMVIDESGIAFPESSVFLKQDDGETPQFDYCEWMPYQKGQAAKAEQLAAKIEELGAVRAEEPPAAS